MEGTGGYGAGLVRLLAEGGEWVVDAATCAQQQLQAMVVTAPEPLRARLRGRTTRQLITACARLRVHPSWEVERRTTTVVLRALARRVLELETEAHLHQEAITSITRGWRPDLLAELGVGPITAATVLAAWSHPGRCRSEAAFAMLGGAAPIPASSGQTVRHRLSRSGDRQLNQALHTIVLTRLRRDPATQAYAKRRRAQGKTDPEILRCLIGGVSAARPAMESGRARGVSQGTAPMSCRPDGQFEFRRPWPRRAHDRLQDIAPARAVNKAPANRARSIPRAAGSQRAGAPIDVCWLGLGQHHP